MSTTNTIASTQRANFPIFRRDQLLTADELNELFTHLYRQSRDTRIFGFGIGVLNGFGNAYNSDADTFTVNKGIGISSDGHLLQVEVDRLFNNIQEFFISEGAFNCRLESEAQSGGNPIPVFALQASANGGSGIKGKPLDNGIYRLVLYRNTVRSIDRTNPQQIKCLVSSDLGSEEARVEQEFLLIKEDIYETLNEQANSDAGTSTARLDLDYLFMDRLGFVEAQNNIDLSQIKDINSLESTYVAAINRAKDLIVPAYMRSVEAANQFLTVSDNVFNNLEANLEGLTDAAGKRVYIQYVYDYLKNLIDAYNEFVELYTRIPLVVGDDLSDLECLHANHVVLGTVMVNSEGISCTTEKRTNFIKLTPEGTQSEDEQRLQSLFQRMVELTDFPSSDNGDEGNIDFPPSEKTIIRITPSSLPTASLGLQSIPFYYVDQNATNGGNNKVRRSWNYDFRNNLERITGYHNGDLFEIPFKQPLFHYLAQFPFLKIEGHVNQTLDTVLEAIESERLRVNVPFDVYCLRVSDFPPNVSTNELLRPSPYLTELERKFIFLRTDLLRELDMLERSFNGGNIPAEVEAFRSFIQADKQIYPETFDFEEFGRIFDAAFPINASAYSIKTQLAYIGREYPAIRLLDLLLEQFSGFSSCYPGLEHSAGVPQGGTFFLVYEEQEVTDGEGEESAMRKVVVADFALPYTRAEWKLPLERFTKGEPYIFSPRGIFCKDDITKFPLVGYPYGADWTLTDVSGNNVSGLITTNEGATVFQPSAGPDAGQLLKLKLTLSEDSFAEVDIILLQISGLQISVPQELAWDRTLEDPTLEVIFSGTVSLLFPDSELSTDDVFFYWKLLADSDFELIDSNIQAGNGNFTFSYTHTFKRSDFTAKVPEEIEVSLRLELGTCVEQVTVPIDLPEFIDNEPVIIKPHGDFCINDDTIYPLEANLIDGTWILEIGDEARIITEFQPSSLLQDLGNLNDGRLTLKYTLPDGQVAEKELQLFQVTFIPPSAEGFALNWTKNNTILEITISDNGSLTVIPANKEGIPVEIYIRFQEGQDWTLVQSTIPDDGVVNIDFKNELEVDDIDQLLESDLSISFRIVYGPCVIDPNDSILISVPAPPEPSEPVALFTADPLEGPSPLTVNFDASQSSPSNPGGSIVEYQWNFGDNSPIATGITVTHTFNIENGFREQFTVILNVIDDLGNEDSEELTITINPSEDNEPILLSPPSDVSDSPNADTSPSDSSSDPIAIFNQRRQRYNQQLDDLKSDSSFTKLKTVEDAEVVINAGPEVVNLDEIFAESAQNLISRIKNSNEKRQQQYQELFGLVIHNYLDKKLNSMKEVVGPEIGLIFQELHDRSEGVGVDWMKVKSDWNGDALKVVYDAELIDQLTNVLDPS